MIGNRSCPYGWRMLQVSQIIQMQLANSSPRGFIFERTFWFIILYFKYFSMVMDFVLKEVNVSINIKCNHWGYFISNNLKSKTQFM